MTATASARARNAASLAEVVLAHRSGLHVLLAPPVPEDAAGLTSDHLCQIVALLRATHAE